MPKNISIFASGRGSNALRIIEYFENNPDVQISSIVTNKATAGVLDIAREYNIPFLIIDKAIFKETTYLVEYLDSRDTDWIILAGFLWLIPAKLIEHFPDRIVNIHPALLPKYGGKGMYGQHVHEAVKNAGDKESGITIHYVNGQYDEGAIIVQESCTLSPEDTTQLIAQKVLKLEHYHYPRVIESLLSGDI